MLTEKPEFVEEIRQHLHQEEPPAGVLSTSVAMPTFCWNWRTADPFTLTQR